MLVWQRRKLCHKQQKVLNMVPETFEAKFAVGTKVKLRCAVLFSTITSGALVKLPKDIEGEIKGSRVDPDFYAHNEALAADIVEDPQDLFCYDVSFEHYPIVRINSCLLKQVKIKPKKEKKDKTKPAKEKKVKAKSKNVEALPLYHPDFKSVSAAAVDEQQPSGINHLNGHAFEAAEEKPKSKKKSKPKKLAKENVNEAKLYKHSKH